MSRILFAAVFAAGLFLAQGHHAFATVDAIAVDDDAATKGGDAGWGTGEGDNEKEAGAMAVKNCKKSGNDNCKVMLTYGKCGAYASSKKYYGTGTGPSEGAAKKDALANCAHDECKVVVSDCVEK